MVFSQTSSKANQFLPGYKRAGKIPAVVDYVAAGSRFKYGRNPWRRRRSTDIRPFRLLLTRDSQSITFVLSGKPPPHYHRHLEFD